MKMLFLWRDAGGTVLFLCCWVALCSLSLTHSLPLPRPLGIPFKTKKRKTLLRTCASLGLSIFRAGEICARFEKNIFLLWILLRGMTTLARLVFSMNSLQHSPRSLSPPAGRDSYFLLSIFPTSKRPFRKGWQSAFSGVSCHVFWGSSKPRINVCLRIMLQPERAVMGNV